MTSSGLREYSLDVGGQNNVSPAIEKILVTAIGHPTRPIGEETDEKLDIAVVFTSVEWPLAALKEAGNLANSLGARIKLVVPQVVPYPLPLENSSGPCGVQRETLWCDGKRKPSRDERANSSVPRSLQNADLGIETRFPRGARWTGKVVADLREEFGQQTAQSRSRSSF